jgi:LysR family transcriptional regulator for metE and metH
VDVKQKFQFGGMAALFSHDIDVLVTPDPLEKPGVQFLPVFAYEQVLAVSSKHEYASLDSITPNQMNDQILLTYPVEKDRLDIYAQFLTPAHCQPARHKDIEDTDIMIQLVAANRGVCALPKWLVLEFQKRFEIQSVRFGEKGIQKNIYLGFREGEDALDYVSAFIQLAQGAGE